MLDHIFEADMYGNGKVDQGKRTSIEMAQLVLDKLSVACNNF